MIEFIPTAKWETLQGRTTASLKKYKDEKRSNFLIAYVQQTDDGRYEGIVYLDDNEEHGEISECFCTIEEAKLWCETTYVVLRKQ